MLSIAVCDDELPDCCHIVRDVREAAEQIGITCTVRQFTSGKELLQTVENFDIIFLDILMGGMDGMPVPHVRTSADTGKEPSPGISITV